MPQGIVTTIVGHVTADPELNYTNSGAAVVRLTIAQNPSTFNRQTKQWEQGDASFLQCSAWRQLAENIAESIAKADRVVAYGRLSERRWEDKDTGQPRSAWQMTVDSLGPDLTFAVAVPKKVQRQVTAPANEDLYETSQGEQPEWSRDPEPQQQPQQHRRRPQPARR